MSESDILKHEQDRHVEFQPNRELEEIIAKLMPVLRPVQEQVNAGFTAPKHPVLLVVGNPRSGTTLTTQWLAEMSAFSFPTNFLSRMAYAPYLGSLIQRMLFAPECDVHGEMISSVRSDGFASNIGKTKGPMAINEFFHFWRRFFPNYDPGHLSDDELRQVDIVGLRREMASIEAVFGKPFVSKGMMFQYNIPFFAEAIPDFFFLHVKRDPLYVMQSALMSKRKFYQDDSIWWSVRPKAYERLKDMSPYHQVAGQLLSTVKAIESGLEHVDEGRRITVDYEDLCDDPAELYFEMKNKYAALDCELPDYTSAESFSCTNSKRLESSELDRLTQAYQELESVC